MPRGQQDGPFVALSRSALRHEPSSSSKVGPYQLEGVLGQCSIGELRWNNQYDSFGLVYGKYVKDIHTVTQRLVNLHLQNLDSQVIILHTNNEGMHNTPCRLLHDSQPSPKVYISPRRPKSMVAAYSTLPTPPLPLGFDETTMTIKQILALFTPPEAFSDHNRILNKIQFIFSQLDEPFDLQRFIQLVDEEKWDEDGATFMALRQTLLTALLAPSGEPFSISDDDSIILVDLTDPVLSSTSLDSVLFEMVLSEACRPILRKRRMIVLDMAHEYLQTSSILSRSLSSLVSYGSDLPTSILFSTTGPTTLPSICLESLDYLVSTCPQAPDLHSFLQKVYPDMYATLQSLRGGMFPVQHIALWSPGSTYIEYSHGERKDRQWSANCVLLEMEELRESMPMFMEKDCRVLQHRFSILQTSTDGFQGVGCSSSREETPVASPHYSIKEHLETTDLGRGYSGSKSATEEEAPLVTVRESPATVQSSPAVLITNPTSEEMANVHPPSTKEDSPSIVAPSPALKAYSESYRPLVAAIESGTNGAVDAWADFEATRKRLGNKAAIRKLGWVTFAQYVKAACKERVIEMRTSEKGTKSVRVLVHDTLPSRTSPLGGGKGHVAEGTSPMTSGVTDATLRENTDTQMTEVEKINGSSTSDLPRGKEDIPCSQLLDMAAQPSSPSFVTPSKYREEYSAQEVPTSAISGSSNLAKANEVSDGDCIPEMRQVVDIGSYPGKFTLLASAILALSGGKTSVPVDFDKCRRLLETQDQLRTGNLDRSTYAELIEAACAEGYAKEGGLTDERWVMLVGREDGMEKNNSIKSGNVQKPTPVQSIQEHRSSSTPLSSFADGVRNSLTDSSHSSSTKIGYDEFVARAKNSSMNTLSGSSHGLNANDYPLKHSVLLSAILGLSNGQTHTKTRYFQILNTLRCQQDHQSLTNEVLISLILKASSDGVVLFGRDEYGLWVAADNPAPPVGLPLADSERPVTERSFSPTKSTSLKQGDQKPEIGKESNPESDTQRLGRAPFPTSSMKYPPKYQKLVKLILGLNGGRAYIKVKLESLFVAARKKPEIRDLAVLLRLVDEARVDNYVETGSTGIDEWVMLKL